MRTASSGLVVALALSGLPAPAARAQATQLWWGDTHLHTMLSLDAFTIGNRSADPDTAYRYAKGLPVVHPGNRARVQIRTPLDFLVVTDHAEYAGAIQRLYARDPIVADTEFGKKFLALVDEKKDFEAMSQLIASINANQPIADLDREDLRRNVWAQIVDTADRHDEPGRFTAFSGWEWTSLTDGANLHRIVFTPARGEVAKQFIPFSSFESDDPERLWAWLEATSQRLGAEFVAIPHNSNVSKGRMFALERHDGAPIDADYARTRMKWEPVVEVTQIKGTSETRPELSPEDEFADFEFFPSLLDTRPDVDRTPTVTAGDYVRPALLRGLELEARLGANPFKFGLQAATDAHTSVASAEEDNFWGKFAGDSIPEAKSKLAGSDVLTGWDMSAAGLTGVWAEANTRAAITAAFKRKETYGTSGPRIAVRLFGGFAFAPGDVKAKDVAALGYAKGVPMGGDLAKAPGGAPPSFLVWAAKDPVGANLDRIQIVKGWLGSDGKPHEKVFDIAWGDAEKRKPDATGKLPPVGNTVDLATGRWTDTIGDAQLATVWKDPVFDASQRAFYYVRVLQIPTPRNSLYDAIALRIDPKETKHPATIQERAYTSPIWYTP